MCVVGLAAASSPPGDVDLCVASDAFQLGRKRYGRVQGKDNVARSGPPFVLSARKNQQAFERYPCFSLRFFLNRHIFERQNRAIQEEARIVR
jgi:hypothetical protein